MISGIQDPSIFNLDTNWFFEDLMFPGLTVPIDLTGQIEDSADRVKVSRIILDAKNQACKNIWENNLANNSYDYVSLKALLVYNNVPYSEDIETINLPLVSNTLTGRFQVMDDPEIIDGNVWYKLDTLNYSSIDSDGTDQGVNNILSVGDQLAYDNTLFSIIGVDQNTNKVRLKLLNGAALPGVYTIFAYYQDPFRSKTINVRFGVNEYDIIYIKGVNEEFNLLANNWSTPIKFFTNTLVKADDININLKDYYDTTVVDWGSQWIAEAKERRLTAYYGQTPNTPTLNSDDLRVVQINTQINAALDTADIKNTASEIERVKSEINDKKLTIATQKTKLQSITDTDKYNTEQSLIASNINELKNLQASYSTLVSSFQTSVQENQAVLENPKYHIRGFFPIPLYKYRDDKQTIPEEIIGFDIAYRYICEDNTGTQLNTFTYTDTDGQSIVTGTFTDWIVAQGPIKQRVFNTDINMYEWKSENVADGTQININQIDIPITKGEKVEIKVRTISEAGYPNNPLKSDWSNTITVSFPGTLSTSNSMADLVKEINDDALNIAIQNSLDSAGVTAHLSDTIPNANSVNGLYFNHEAKNIAYENVSEDGLTTTSISLQDKVTDLELRLSLLEKYLNEQIEKINA